MQSLFSSGAEPLFVFPSKIFKEDGSVSFVKNVILDMVLLFCKLYSKIKYVLGLFIFDCLYQEALLHYHHGFKEFFSHD